MLGGKENLPLECLFVCEFCLSFYPQACPLQLPSGPTRVGGRPNRQHGVCNWLLSRSIVIVSVFCVAPFQCMLQRCVADGFPGPARQPSAPRTVVQHMQRHATALQQRGHSLRPSLQKDYLVRHLTKCKHRHPPGDEIYRNGDIAMFEVGLLIAALDAVQRKRIPLSH